MQAVIMAGGKGTRLRAITNDKIPKPMVSVAGKPILQWQIERLREQDVTDMILITGHLGEEIQEFFADGKKFGVNIRYIRETAPLGTAGALSMLSPMLEEDAFFLVFGDVLFDIDLGRMMAFHREKHAKATLLVHPNSHPFDSDLVVYDSTERVIGLDFKNSVRAGWYHNCVNAGFYILEKSVCEMVPEETKVDLEKHLLAGMVGRGEAVYAYRSSEYIKDVGTVERITAAEVELQSGYIAGRCLKRKQRAIFLDRDGTVNRKRGLVYQEEQFELEDGVIEAIRNINESGYLAILVTNQPVVARGLCSVEDVENIHRKLETLLGREGVYLDDIRYCPHHPDKGYPEENPVYKISCHCRKPKIGMIEDCVKRYNIDLESSWMVGDTTMDIQTGKNAGTRTVLVLTGDAGQDEKYNVTPDLVCDDLGQAVQKILEEDENGL